jgi:hypothetical protein
LWIATGLLATILLVFGVLDEIAAPPVVASLQRLGYPDYVRPVLGAAKLLAVVGLFAPRMPV